MLIWRARIRWDIQSNNTQTAGVADRIDELVEYHSGLFLTGWLGGLIPHGINAAVHAIRLDCIVNLLAGVAVVEVNGFGANVFGKIQPVFDVIYDEHWAGTLQLC